jgi:hypothetical protein
VGLLCRTTIAQPFIAEEKRFGLARTVLTTLTKEPWTVWQGAAWTIDRAPVARPQRSPPSCAEVQVRIGACPEPRKSPHDRRCAHDQWAGHNPRPVRSYWSAAYKTVRDFSPIARPGARSPSGTNRRARIESMKRRPLWQRQYDGSLIYQRLSIVRHHRRRRRRAGVPSP